MMELYDFFLCPVHGVAWPLIAMCCNGWDGSTLYEYSKIKWRNFYEASTAFLYYISNAFRI
jgi:hypothetical protein